MAAMRYVMKQKIFSFGDDYQILDEHGDHLATVDGKVFAIGQKLAFVDRDGKELARIEQRLLSLKPTYDILREGERVASVSKDFFTLLRASFTVDVPGPDDLEAQGNLTDHEYEFTRHGKRVATVSKKWFRLTDTYGVDVAPGEDPILILASAVVIDLCCHQPREEEAEA